MSAVYDPAGIPARRRYTIEGHEVVLRHRSDIYATPILFGCAVFVLLRGLAPAFAYPGLVGTALIFAVRGLAIHYHLEMPLWLTAQEAGTPSSR